MSAEILVGIIRRVMPNCRDAQGWAAPLHKAMTRYGIAQDKDFVAAFLAQIAVESGEMNRLDENLSYSAERLMAVWPKRFPTAEVAQRYARKPHALADFVYSNRMGNGSPESGDGYKYRGRGLKMITGKDNYKACGAALGVDLLANPDYLQTKEGAALSAAWYWSSKGLSPIADDLPDDDDNADFVTITKLINGGTTGLEQRRLYWARAKQALGL
jgi:putative chitinase